MKRHEVVERLIKEGFSEKTLVKFNDTQLNKLAAKVLSEETVMISKTSPTYVADLTAAKKAKKTIETYEETEIEESKPSSGLSKAKKSEVVKKAKKGEDIGKKGKGFEKIVAKAKESGAKDPEAVAGAAMWKNIKREGSNELNEWVKTVIEKNYHAVATKGDVMEAIKTKLAENETMVPMPAKAKKGHNGIPEFMTYDAITDAAQPSEAPTRRETPTRERPTREKEPSENPRKSPFRNPDKTPGQQPLVNPKPKAKEKGGKVVSLNPTNKSKMAAE